MSTVVVNTTRHVDSKSPRTSCTIANSVHSSSYLTRTPMDQVKYTSVSTKCHKGVPLCLLYKGPRRFIAIDFSFLISSQLYGHPYREDKDNRYMTFVYLKLPPCKHGFG